MANGTSDTKKRALLVRAIRYKPYALSGSFAQPPRTVPNAEAISNHFL
jgi:hypothetical protein